VKSPVLLVAAMAAALAAGAALGGTPPVVFIEGGQPRQLTWHSRDWSRGEGYLEAAGTDKELWAAKAIGRGDFHVTAQLTILKLARSAAAFRVGESYFGFEGAHGKVFLTGPLFNASGKGIGNPADFLTDGKPFTFEVVRTGRRLAFRIDGKVAHEMACTDEPLGPIGFIPWRSTMRIRDFSAEGNLEDAKFPEPRERVGPTEADWRAARGEPAVLEKGGVTRIRLLPPGPGNPRNSEGDFIQLKDGRLLFVYTRFTGGGADHAAAYLASRTSSDGGRTWTKDDAVVVPQEGKQNVMSVSLLRLHSGEIALFYLRKNAIDDCRPYLRLSTDEAKTWSEPTLCVPPGGYYVLNNDRVVQLKGGRLVAPVARHTEPGGKFSGHGVVSCFLSDDKGSTWRQSRSQLTGKTPKGHVVLQEPGVVELKDGRLLMFMRTNAGCQYRSFSKDGGESWSPAEPSNIISPVSPASIERIPTTGELLLVWNDHRDVEPACRGKRTPFTAAISRDEGETWEKVRTLEDDPGGWYCYTAVEFVGDRVVLGHCAGRQATGGLNLTQITLFDVDWLRR